MAAFAIQNVISTRYYMRLDSTLAGRETDYAFLLDASRSHTQSQTAVVYTFEPETFEVNAIAVRSSGAARLKDVGVTLSGSTSRWLDSLASAVQGKPGAEPNFEKFPEALQYHVKRLAVVPLRNENTLFGLLNLGRSGEASFEPKELDIAQRAGRLLTALLERDTLQQKLAERKLVERAKGILQQRRRLSEEQAYLMLRNNSRRRRIPMASIAKEIIEVSVAHSVGVEQGLRRFKTA
jgi:GAF domain-containing protein